MPTDRSPAATGDEQQEAVEIHGDNGCPTYGSATDYQYAVIAPLKMHSPALGAGIVERYDLTGFRIDRVGLGAFALVAGAAREPQVLALGGATNCPWDDVLDAQGDSADALVGMAIAA